MSISASITSSIGQSISNSIGSGPRAIFESELQSSLIPQIVNGDPTPTFIRATTDKFWGFAESAIVGASPILLSVASGEAGFLGSRRISEGVWSKFLNDGAPIKPANVINAPLYVDSLGPFGYRSQGARTNVALHNRDFTDVVWVKTTMTAAKDETGIDDVANSASSLLATAGNATALQGFTIASTAQVTSFWLKRLVGSGTINITLDNGVTFTPVVLTSEFERFFVTATLANPTIGIQIVTSGDKIAVDYSQLEAATFPSSEIETTASSEIRNTDALTYDDASNILDAQGTAFASVSSEWSVAGADSFALARSNTGRMLYASAGDISNVIRAFGGTGVTVSPAGTNYNNSPQKIVSTWGSVLIAHSPETLSPDTTPASYNGTMGLGAIGVGHQNNGAFPWFGTIRNVKILNKELNTSEVAAL